MQSFEEFGKFVLENSNHNTRDSEQVHIILDYPKINWNDYAQYMATLTWWTGVGWRKNGNTESLIFAKDLDEAVKLADKHKYAMVSYIGSFYYNWNRDNPETIHTYFDEFCESDKPCKGHILWRPKNQYARLHQQCMFLNLDHWRKIGKPSFGKYSGRVVMPERSESNVHDDYTPHWLSPSDYAKVKQVTKCEMADYISKVIEDGHTIYNFDKERNVKFFCYPERRYCKPLEQEENKNDNIVYVKNNEKYSALVYKTNVKFDVIYAPASGFCAEFLYDCYGHENTELVIYDINKDSLNWKKMVYEFKDIERIEKFYKSKEGVIVDDADYEPEIVEENEKIFSQEKIEKIISSIKNVRFLEFDAISDPISKLNIDEDKVNLVYTSNIFCYNYLIHRHSVETIQNRWNEFLSLDGTIIGGKNLFRDDTVYGNL